MLCWTELFIKAISGLKTKTMPKRSCEENNGALAKKKIIKQHDKRYINIKYIDIRPNILVVSVHKISYLQQKMKLAIFPSQMTCLGDKLYCFHKKG